MSDKVSVMLRCPCTNEYSKTFQDDNYTQVGNKIYSSCGCGANISTVIEIIRRFNVNKKVESERE